VSNEYLTVNFLANKLGIKKQNIQDYLLYLISEDSLKGKYDPRLGIYYENPEILNKIDENNLEVEIPIVQKLKDFAAKYFAIFSIFGTIFSLASSIYVLSGGNMAALLIPGLLIPFILAYAMLQYRKEKKAEKSL